MTGQAVAGRRGRPITRAVLAGLVAAFAVSATPAAAAQPSEVRCGEPVVADAVLDRDLDCPANGPLLTTGDVTLDLNGHAIRGSGQGTGIRIEYCTNAGDLVIKNGSVSGFNVGISVPSHLVSSHVACHPPVTTTIAHLLIEKNRIGILGGTDGGRTGLTLVRDNTIRANVEHGIFTAFIRPFHVVGNDIKNNGGRGIYAYEDSIDRLEGNVISRNGGHGAFFDDSVSDILNNRFMRNGGTGLRISERVCFFSSFYDVSGNTAMHNTGGGMMAEFPSCEEPPDRPPGDGNVAKHNEGFQCILIRCTSAPGFWRPTGTPTAIRHSR